MVRNFRKMTAEVKEKLAQDKRAADHEKDTVYWLYFLPKTAAILTQSQEEADLWKSQWRVQLPGNPENDPEMVPRAISRWEIDRGVNSWDEIAIRYEIKGTYFP